MLIFKFIRSIKRDVFVHEKVTTLKGMVNIIALNPNGIRFSIVDFIDVVTHWDDATLNLRKGLQKGNKPNKLG